MMGSNQEFVFPKEVLEHMKKNPLEKPQIEVQLIVSHEEDGKQIVEQCIYPHSFVKALIWILGTRMRQSATSDTIPDTTDNARTLNHAGSIDFQATAASADDLIGIVFGTGTSAITMTDNKLGTKIAEGTGAGQLSHAACNVSQATIDGTDAYFTITRQVTNSSGAEITVNEVGLYALARDSGGTSRVFLVDRTLNTAAIANGASKTYTYKIKITI